MKLSKKTLIVIGAVIFVVAAIGLYMVWSGQADEQNELNEKLTLAQTRLGGIQLEKLAPRQAELEEQL